jgi:L-ascorbate 6-phosphate lactonase
MIINLEEDIEKTKVPKGQVGIIWLGQSGFLFKTDSGKIILLDAYLSDCCERVVNFKRIYPNILNIEELKVDYIIISHEHPDHLDFDAVPLIMKNNSCVLISPESCAKHFKKMDFDDKRNLLISEGELKNLNDFKIKGVFCDHGEYAKDTLGYILYFNDIKVYFASDTAYNPEKMSSVIMEKPDVAILPINGAYGNLSPIEATCYAKIIKSKIIIPCHFWTFVEHDFGSPRDFKEAMKKFYPEGEAKILKCGEIFIL